MPPTSSPTPEPDPGARPVAVPADEAAQVRARWERLGLPGLVDVHTHFMPQRVLDKVWAFFDRVDELAGRAWPIAYRLPEPERVARLTDFGLLGFTALAYPHRPDMAAWLNEHTLDLASRTAGCAPSATFYPEPAAPSYVADALHAGARVFKSHVQVGDYDPRDPLLDEVWGLVAEAQVPVVLHAGSGPHPGTFTGPGPVAEVLARHPRLVLVVAHMGLPEYGDFLDLAAAYEGVHLDTTMAFTPYVESMHPFPAAERARLRDLGDRIVWGSDFPNIPYPYLDGLDAVIGLDLGDDWLRAVLHDNGARLLRLS